MTMVLIIIILSAFFMRGTFLIPKTVISLGVHKNSYKGSFIIVEFFR